MVDIFNKRPFLGVYLLNIAYVLITLYVTVTEGQYLQDWVFGPDASGATVPWWRPNPNAQLSRVWYWDSTLVYLTYNCHYMTAICQNAGNFMYSPRGLNRSQQNMFSYDFGRRTSRRRTASCPPSWRAWHFCPELNQPPVWRQDGRWPYIALDPVQTPPNVIQHIRGAFGTVVSNSYLRYTCEEFPAATWVEGGSGHPTVVQPAETRCAAYRCPGTAGMKVYGEQNWQARAHTLLRRVLQNLALQNLGQGLWDARNEPVVFLLNLDNQPNGFPATVHVFSSITNQVTFLEDVPMSKRSERTNMTLMEHMALMSSVRLDEMEKYGYREVVHRVHVIDSFSQEKYPWYDDFDWRSNITSPMVNPEFRSGSTRALAPIRDQPLPERHTSQNSATSNSSIERGPGKPVRRNTPKTRTDAAPLVKNATAAEIETARKLVDKAIAASGDRNRARFAHMSRNHYILKPGTVVGGSRDKRRKSAYDSGAGKREEEDGSAVPPALLKVKPELAAAAALVAEADAVGLTGNMTFASANSRTGGSRKSDDTGAATAAAGTFWMEMIDRKGSVPWGKDANYKVFRNVRDYGAKGDGKTDDKAAIKKAMSDGNRCGKNCNGSTTKNAIVYFPPGTYMVSSGILVYFGTQLIGDANNWPTIVAAKRFIGTGVLSTDEYTGGGAGPDGRDQEWYVNTASFYRQIRNFRVDVTETRPAQEVACLHYQVAQATSLQFMELIAKSGTKQRGIVAENGSGGVLADITFTGGSYGLWGGEQQFTAQRLTFNGCSTAVQVIWDWGWVWKSITVNDADVGFRLLPEEEGEADGNIGSATFMDSTFNNFGTAVLVAPINSAPGSGSTGVVIDNVAFRGVQRAVADTSGATLLAASDKVASWATGPVYAPDRKFYTGKDVPAYRREKNLLDGSGAYFERAKPQYEGRSAGDFVHLKDLGATGDGVTDDTQAVQAALDGSIGKIIFVDAGTYVLTGTVIIPSGTKMVGETWSQFAASGPYFANPRVPKAMFQIGLVGQVGDVEMQNLIFTTKGQTPGAILIQWNLKASAPGSAGMWDCHTRVGGATGTGLTPSECPAATSGIDANCQAASLMMHLTKSGSGYFENMWLWVADHIVDDPLLDDPANDMEMISVYVGRGFLIESQEATWLYGTASEHSVYYQYNFNGAKNIFVGFLQTESPYYQPTPKPPQPFEGAVGRMAGDPTYKCDGSDFDGCDSSWAVIIRGSQNVFVASAGLYSWFSTYAQDCNNNSGSVRIQNLVTIGAKYSLVQESVGVRATDNLNVNSHPSWSQISIFDSTGNEVIWIDPTIWSSPTPTVWCQAPCLIKLPPWTGATITYDYPIITASGNGWTTKVTREPITATAWVLEIATVRDATVRQPARRDEVVGSIWATFTPTPVWPTLAFRGGDQGLTTTRPTSPIYPSPPQPAGPTPPPSPPAGHWPGAVVVARGAPSPRVGICDWNDPTCNAAYWDTEYYWQPVFSPPDGSDGDEDPEERDPEDEGVFCPMTTTTSSSRDSPTPPTTPIQDPVAVPSPAENKVECYNSGAKATHPQAENAIKSFCNALSASAHGLLGKGFYQSYTAPFDVSNNQAIQIEMSVELGGDCEWQFDVAECRRYLLVPVDSCDCGGAGSKQGGVVRNNCITWRLYPNCQSGSVCL